MILVRDVFQAKYGKGDELVAVLKEGGELMRKHAGLSGRILTDASGPFFTVITETEVESLGTWEQALALGIGDAEFAEWFAQMVPLVESGRRDFFTIVP
jgi:hypothetical protein